MAVTGPGSPGTWLRVKQPDTIWSLSSSHPFITDINVGRNWRLNSVDDSGRHSHHSHYTRPPLLVQFWLNHWQLNMTSPGGSGWLVFMLIKSHWSSARESRHSWHLPFLPVYCRMYFLARAAGDCLGAQCLAVLVSLHSPPQRLPQKIWCGDRYPESMQSPEFVFLQVDTCLGPDRCKSDGGWCNVPGPGATAPTWCLQHCSMMSAVRSTGVDRGRGNDRPVSAVLWRVVIRILCRPDNNRALSDGQALERKTVGSQSQNMNVKWTLSWPDIWGCWENLPGYWHVDWHLFCVSILCHKIVMNTPQCWFGVTDPCLAWSTSSLDARQGPGCSHLM